MRLTRRQLLRRTLAGSAALSVGALIAACGQPVPTQTAISAGGAAPLAATPVPDGTPGTPGTPATRTIPPDMPLTATAVALVPTMSGPTVAAPPRPSGTVVYPTQAPTAPIPTLDQPQTRPTKRPEDPHRVTSVSSPNRNVDWLVLNSALVVLGQVQEVYPAQWSTSNGQRPANPHVNPPEAFIYRPVRFAVEQRLAGQDAGNVLHLYAAGGQVGQDIERVEPGDIYEFSPGERAVVFLTPPWAQIARTWNGQTLWVPREQYTVTADGQARTIERRVPLQQLLDEIAAAQA